jgi:hypothetical protein
MFLARSTDRVALLAGFAPILLEQFASVSTVDTVFVSLLSSLLTRCTTDPQEETVIVVGKKGGRAIVSALDNVMRISRNRDPWRSRHLASHFNRSSKAYRRIRKASTKKFSDPNFLIYGCLGG